jgi:hypothetical protein
MAGPDNGITDADRGLSEVLPGVRRARQLWSTVSSSTLGQGAEQLVETTGQQVVDFANTHALDAVMALMPLPQHKLYFLLPDAHKARARIIFDNLRQLLTGYFDGLTELERLSDLGRNALDVYVDSSTSITSRLAAPIDLIHGFLIGLSNGVEDLRLLAFWIADLSASESKRKVAQAELSSGLKLLTRDNRDTFWKVGNHAAVRSMSDLGERMTSARDWHRYVGELSGQIAFDFALAPTKVLRKPVKVLSGKLGNLIFARYTGTRPSDTVMDRASRRAIGGLRLSPRLTEIAGTGGISRIVARKLADGTLAVDISGRYLPSLARSRKQVMDTFIRTGRVQEMAPNFTRYMFDANEFGGDRKLSGRWWHKAHLVGPGFGDEAAAGMAFARREVNLFIQNGVTEFFIRKSGKAARERGFEIHYRAGIRYFQDSELHPDFRIEPKRTPGDGRPGNFTRSGGFPKRYSYEFELRESGEMASQRFFVTFLLHPPPDGRIRAMEFSEPMRHEARSLFKDYFDQNDRNMKIFDPAAFGAEVASHGK